MKKNIPFYSNLKTDTHCFQACLKMVLKHCFPDKDYSFEYLDKVTFHKKDKWTWDSGALLFLSKLGFDVVRIVNFDYKQFVEFGEEYLRMIWNDEVFNTQKQYSDFDQERKLAQDLLKNGSIKLERRWTNLKEVEDLFQKDFLVMTSINPYILDNEEGYSSHLVVITGFNEDSITFHDPGLPPQKNRTVSKKTFEKAMQYPHKESADLFAVKHPKC